MIKHRLPDTEYHADPAIGSTTAKLWLTSPQLFADARAGIYAVEDKGYFQVGRIAHMMVLESERFKELVTTEGPINPRTGKPYGRDTQAFADWQDAHQGVVVVEPWLYTMLERMPSEVRTIFAGPGEAELSVFRTISGVDVKCRPDWLRFGTVTDFKTIADIDTLDRHINRMRYWFSAGWYRLILREEFGTTFPYQFVFAEKRPPFRWRIVKLDVDWLMYADEMAERVINEIAAGDWSDKSEVSVMVSRPVWEVDAEEGDDDAL